MKLTKIKLFILTILAAAWIPAVLLFINPGWVSFMFLQPLRWPIFTLVILPLVIPILNLHFKRGPVPRVDAWLQIVFCIAWFLLGIFLVNFGDTSESIGSIFTDLFVGFTDRQLLNTISSITTLAMFLCCSFLFTIITLRAISDKIVANNLKKNRQPRAILTRSLFFTGITAGILSSFLGVIVDTFPIGLYAGNEAGTAAALRLAITALIIWVTSIIMLCRLKVRNSLSTSVFSTALVSLILVGIRVWQQHYIGNPYGLTYVDNQSWLVTYAIFTLCVAIATPLTFLLAGSLIHKVRSTFANIIIILFGLSFSVWALGLQSTITDNAITAAAKQARQSFYDSIDFTLYTPNYLPGGATLSSQQLYGRSLSRGGASFSTTYSNSGADGKFYNFYFGVFNKQKLSQQTNPNCSPPRSSGTTDLAAHCHFIGETSNGGRVYLIQRPNESYIFAVSVNLGDTRVLIEPSAPSFDSAEAMKIAESLKEVPKESIPNNGWWNDILR